MSNPQDQKGKKQDLGQNSASSPADDMKVQPVSQKTGVLPRSIGRTINKIKRELDPKAEEDFVRKFRTSRNRTRVAIRFVLLLVIIPLLVHNLASIMLMPIVERTRGDDVSQIFLNREMEEEALHELKLYESKLKLKILLHKSPEIKNQHRKKRLAHRNKTRRQFLPEIFDRINLLLRTRKKPELFTYTHPESDWGNFSFKCNPLEIFGDDYEDKIKARENLEEGR